MSERGERERGETLEMKNIRDEKRERVSDTRNVREMSEI